MEHTTDANSGSRAQASTGDPASAPAPHLESSRLLATAFVTGAAVMVIEILGTRLIGPVFGVSLFVWSSLLAVTLGSLAVGYYAGGVLVDRTPRVRLLNAIIAGAGVLLALVPALSHFVLASTEALGPRGGPFASAALLFAPSLITLGGVGPVAVRLATTHLRATGHRVGAVYAVSTCGSLVGTLLTAFVFIPAFETDQIFLGTAVLLIVLGGVPLALQGSKTVVLAVLVPLASAAVPRAPLPSGFTIVDQSHSLYGLVQVIDDTSRGVRLLRSDHSIIGAQWLNDHTSAFSFIHLLEAIRFARPAATNMLEIGLGTGALPSILGPLGITVDVVEIDPAVVRFAKSYFGFSTRGEIHVEDARTFLRRTTNRYDLIVHDTFTGGATPDHLLSLEVVRQLREALRPGGVVALNFVGYQRGPKAEASRAVARTLRAVFPVVQIYRDTAPDDGPDDVGNLVFFASDAALDFAIPESARRESEALRNFPSWEVLRDVPAGPVITDARNPLARLQLPIAEEHFVGMNRLLPVEVWLH